MVGLSCAIAIFMVIVDWGKGEKVIGEKVIGEKVIGEKLNDEKFIIHHSIAPCPMPYAPSSPSLFNNSWRLSIAIEKSGLISIALSKEAIASEYLSKVARAMPRLCQA